MFNPKKIFENIAWSVGLVVLASAVSAEEPAKSRADLREPVYRITKQDRKPTTTAPASIVSPSTQPMRQDVLPSSTSESQTNAGTGTEVTAVSAKAAPHPLDTSLDMAHAALEKSRSSIDDYTAILVKRERVGGTLNDEQYMLVKIRNEKTDANDRVAVPFSVYLKFLKPSTVKGREVIYVKGRNNGKLIAHEGGLKGRFTPSLSLDPNGALAMMGQRYPCTDIGLENLCVKLIKRGGRDRSLGCNCVVNKQPANINQRPATRIEVMHQERKPHLDFHVARIYVDDQYGIPIRYEAFDWPKTPGAEVTENELIEEYTYVRLKFNVGLTDHDFDPANPAYNMK